MLLWIYVKVSKKVNMYTGIVSLMMITMTYATLIKCKIVD